MAELDYAYLADFARIQEGKLTAVGASFTHVFTQGFPTTVEMALAGRVRLKVDEQAPELEVTVQSVKNDVSMTVSGPIAPGPGTLQYDGKQGVLFTLDIDVPAAVPDLFTVDISLNGEHVRRLACEVIKLKPADAE